MREEKKNLQLDRYECGVIFHSLNHERNQRLKENLPTEAVDDVLLKVIDQMEAKGKRAKRGRRHEAR